METTIEKKVETVVQTVDVPTQEAVVAPGRTVNVAAHFKPANPGDKAVFPVEAKTHHPGDKVTLPANEVDRLRGLGFLVDPGSTVLPIGEGPAFHSEEGPQIQKV